MNKFDYLRTAELNAEARGVTLTAPATLYAAYSTTAWIASDTGSTAKEPVSDGYTRVALSTTGLFAAPAVVGGIMQMATLVDINFPLNTTADHGMIPYIAFFDAASAGNGYRFGTLTTPKLIQVGDFLKLPAGSLIFGEQ